MHMTPVLTYLCCTVLLNQEAKEHFDKLKADYQAQVEKLTNLVDSGVDAVDFIKVSGQLVYCNLGFIRARVRVDRG